MLSIKEINDLCYEAGGKCAPERLLEIIKILNHGAKDYVSLVEKIKGLEENPPHGPQYHHRPRSISEGRNGLKKELISFINKQ